MAAVKKAQAENKAATARKTVTREVTDSGLVTVVVGPGPIHHGGQHRAPGDLLEVPEDVAVVLVAAKLAARAKG